MSIKSFFEVNVNIPSSLIIDGCPDLFPEISIMIPTFNRPELLDEAIQSAINQKVDFNISFEVVVVDNCSNPEYTNDIDRVVKKYIPGNIRLFRNKKNIGMYGNWNRCIELARGRFLSILNDDDILHLAFLQSCYQNSLNNSSMISVAHVTFSRVTNIKWRESESEFEPLKIADFLAFNPIFGSLGMLMRRDLAIEIGGYNLDKWPTSDYYFNFEYFKRFGIKKTKAVLAGYRYLANESLKKETLHGFLNNDVKFRCSIANLYLHSNFQKKIFNFLNKCCIASSAVRYKKLNKEFDCIAAYNKYDIGLFFKVFFSLPLVTPFFDRARCFFWSLVINIGSKKIKRSNT
ncbi:glycosyltransferase family 2 protein [Xenorhabdus eapokensis]|uniref:Glycosyltransferase 2-like domain-containing protein n=1 Tax=Xenorhabdus eapokensis TaxID=1873482 RepID=A0A1Q5TP03_9GAMM|nr:glycosyltransferase family 2 protein [Xenorhabdus eapokensis]OKP01941.1 hypothetical protein Xedl_02636 [Xenorhabdus eapokensis]